MRKCLATKTIARCAALFLFCLLPLKGICQTGESTVNTLVEMGFENVGWTEDGKERVYVLQNSAYRLNGVGIGKAVDIIQKMGLPDNVYRFANADSIQTIRRMESALAKR